MKAFLTGMILFGLSVAGWADDEASNVAHVAASSYGRCYAKSVPEDPYFQRGTTRIYSVGQARDELKHTFNWFSQRIYIECNVSAPSGPVAISVTRFGPWARGQKANEADLALAFYFGDELKERYSTLDIAGEAENVSRSVSHYTVIDKVEGYRWVGSGNRYEFIIRTTDGRTLQFDPATGAKVVGP